MKYMKLKRVKGRDVECEDCGAHMGRYYFADGNDNYCHVCAKKYGKTPETTGERITALRGACGMSRSELVRKIEAVPATADRWERHDGLPNGYYLIKLALALNTSSDYLLCLRDDP